MQVLMKSNLREQSQKLEFLNKRLQVSHPGQWVQQQQQKLDFLAQKLNRLAERQLEQAQSRLDRLKQGLSPSNLTRTNNNYQLR